LLEKEEEALDEAETEVCKMVPYNDGNDHQQHRRYFHQLLFLKC